MTRLLKSKLFWVLAIPLLLVGLYALVGFRLAPGLVRDQAQKFVRENYGRELAIGEVRINPFRLDIELRDLAFPDADGQPMLAFERMYADFELASLWNRAFTFREVTVEAPLVRAVIRPDGAMNLADLALPETPRSQMSRCQACGSRRSTWREGPSTSSTRRDGCPTNAASRRWLRARGLPHHARGRRLPPVGAQPGRRDLRLEGPFRARAVIASQGEFRVGALRTPGAARLPRRLAALHFDDRHDGPGRVLPRRARRAGRTRSRTADHRHPRPQPARAGRRRAMGEDPSVVVSGVKAVLPAQTVRVETVAIEALQAQAWLDADGSINLERLFAAPRTPSQPRRHRSRQLHLLLQLQLQRRRHRHRQRQRQPHRPYRCPCGPRRRGAPLERHARQHRAVERRDRFRGPCDRPGDKFRSRPSTSACRRRVSTCRGLFR